PLSPRPRHLASASRDCAAILRALAPAPIPLPTTAPITAPLPPSTADAAYVSSTSNRFGICEQI
ncbi:hypothetical protein U1Q18_011602, partial [Sarracenia purpurea var. burkii]